MKRTLFNTLICVLLIMTVIFSFPVVSDAKGNKLYSGSCYLMQINYYTYTGKAIKPKFTVYDSKKNRKLTYGVDYSVSGYKNNVNPGDGSAVVMFKNSYKGYKSLKPTIRIMTRSVKVTKRVYNPNKRQVKFYISRSGLSEVASVDAKIYQIHDEFDTVVGTVGSKVSKDGSFTITSKTLKKGTRYELCVLGVPKSRNLNYASHKSVRFGITPDGHIYNR